MQITLPEPKNQNGQLVMQNYQTHGIGIVNIGKNCSIGNNVKFIFKTNRTLTLGDYVTLGDGVKVIIEDGDVSIDDWTTLHSDCLVLSTKGVSIGQHCWFGQNCVIDGTGGLTIGNGVRVGMYSQIWTHIAAGEQIEGCLFYSADPVVIQDNVWLVGSCTVGSGVTIGKRAVCLSGSNIIKSVPENVTVAGAPAKVKEHINAYTHKSLDEKFEMLRGWIKDFCDESNHAFAFKNEDNEKLTIHSTSDLNDQIIMFKYTESYSAAANQEIKSKACIETKTYTKGFTLSEERVMRYLSGNKARFLRD